MPRKNIFVRDEDLELWDAIEDRPRWVHDALRATGKEYPKAVRERKEIETMILGKEIPKEGLKICEHGAGERLCKVKGCKFYQFKHA